MKRIELSLDVVHCIIEHWNAVHPSHFYTHDEIIDYYQSVGYDLNYRQYRTGNSDWTGGRIIYTLPADQATFFLLAYGS